LAPHRARVTIGGSAGGPDLLALKSNAPTGSDLAWGDTAATAAVVTCDSTQAKRTSLTGAGARPAVSSSYWT